MWSPPTFVPESSIRRISRGCARSAKRRLPVACRLKSNSERAEDRTRNENVALREDIVRSSMFEEIVGSSEPLRKVMDQVSRVSPTDSTVLVLGETGTGKELIARAIHNQSKR